MRFIPCFCYYYVVFIPFCKGCFHFIRALAKIHEKNLMEHDPPGLKILIHNFAHIICERNRILKRQPFDKESLIVEEVRIQC